VEMESSTRLSNFPPPIYLTTSFKLEAQLKVSNALLSHIIITKNGTIEIEQGDDAKP